MGSTLEQMQQHGCRTQTSTFWEAMERTSAHIGTKRMPSREDIDGLQPELVTLDGVSSTFSEVDWCAFSPASCWCPPHLRMRLRVQACQHTLPTKDTQSREDTDGLVGRGLLPTPISFLEHI